MSDPADNGLNTCGCCDNDIPEPALYNPPGQDELDYRVSTYSSFLARMVARLARERPPGTDEGESGPLAALTTRSSDDFAMALLDAWAVVGDVLTFYQERIANEGFLRTAAERRSVLELARAIGYELNPGVAAETYLAFTVDDSDTTPDSANIAAGTQVQSIPQAQGELPQIFETSGDFTAYVAWNEMRPRLSQPQTISTATTTLYLSGTGLKLKAGDMLLLVQGTSAEPRRIAAVEEDTEEKQTVVDLEEAAGLSGAVSVYALRDQVAVFGHNAPHYNVFAAAILAGDSGVAIPFHDWDASGWSIWYDSIKPASGYTNYYSPADLYLERSISGLTTGSYIVIVNDDGDHEAYTIGNIADRSLTGFGLSGKSTGLTLKELDGTDLYNAEKPSGYLVRETTVYLKSELLTLAGSPITDPLLSGAYPLSQQTLSLTLGEAVDGLYAGQLIALSGEDQGGVGQYEIVELKSVTTNSEGLTVLHFASALAYSYERETVTINANVVKASHGETVSGEILGSGNGSQRNQSFTLKKPPLTHISAATASGAESELELRVNDVKWEQVASLYDLDSDGKSYIVRLDDDANATIIFGDGKSGARLPTGQENVKATYRSGIGLDGEVGAGTLTLFKTRPFGVREVTNPLEAAGAEDPEELAGARENAPLTVLTLDRVVSLRDYEDFARAFAGIGKAQAVAVWSGDRELVHITIAGSDGDEIAEDDAVYGNLLDAIDAARDPLRELRLASFDRLTFDLAAKVLIDDAYIWENVQADIEDALLEAFDFKERAFGQPVTAAEIIYLIHQIEGVIAVDIDGLALTGVTSPPFSPVLRARVATYDPATGEILEAQLLLINESGITLTEMTL